MFMVTLQTLHFPHAKCVHDMYPLIINVQRNTTFNCHTTARVKSTRPGQKGKFVESPLIDLFGGPGALNREVEFLAVSPIPSTPTCQFLPTIK